MIVVATVAVLAVVIFVTKVLLWDAVTVGVTAIGVEIIVVGVVVIILYFALTSSCSVDVPSSDVDVNLFMDVLADTMLGVMSESRIEVFADVNTNAFAVVMMTVL